MCPLTLDEKINTNRINYVERVTSWNETNSCRNKEIGYIVFTGRTVGCFQTILIWTSENYREQQENDHERGWYYRDERTRWEIGCSSD